MKFLKSLPILTRTLPLRVCKLDVIHNRPSKLCTRWKCFWWPDLGGQTDLTDLFFRLLPLRSVYEFVTEKACACKKLEQPNWSTQFSKHVHDQNYSFPGEPRCSTFGDQPCPQPAICATSRTCSMAACCEFVFSAGGAISFGVVKKKSKKRQISAVWDTAILLDE